MDIPVRFVTAADGVRIAYAEKGQGRPLVFVRGWFSHLELLWDQAESRRYFDALSERFRLITFDCRGNGMSDRDVPPPTIEALTSDLEAVMDGAQVQGATLYGMGYGGPVAVRYAARHPDRVAALVLFGTRDRPEGLPYDTYVEAVEKLPGGLLLPAWHTSRDDPEQVARSVDYISQSCERPMVGRFFELTERFDVREEAACLPMPALVMHARRSSVPFALGREMAASIPSAQFVALEGSDWNPWRVEPERNLQIIDGFLQDLGIVEPQDPRVPEPAAAPYMFRREGEYWTIAFEGSAIRLRDARGLHYLSRLLSSPGRELHVAQLAGATRAEAPRRTGEDLSADSGHAGDMLDAATRAAYENRIEELRSEIADARRWDDDVRESRAAEELDAIAQQLAAAFGLGGRARRSADAAERMRKAITNRVKDSLTKIRREHPSLGAHLDASVRTGTFCCYEPPHPVSWSL